MGSPPHTRGIPRTAEKRRRRHGFTPAYAGNTRSLISLDKTYRVHPRIRGEYIKGQCEKAGFKGSPPHTRGIPALAALVIVINGFTPAYAGNTTLS